MKKVIITSGFFNPIHSGHISLIREARKLGDFLVVIVNNDEQVKLKGSMPFMSEQERIEIVKALKYSDDVILSIDSFAEGKEVPIPKSLEMAAKKYPGAELFFAKGGDRNIDNLPKSEKEVCQKFNIKIISNVGGEKAQSSSGLIKDIINKFFSIKIMEKIKGVKSIEVLGSKIDMVQIPDVIEMMDYWIKNEREKCHWIVATGMHGVMEAQRDKEFKNILSYADLWAPDGISLVWMARLNGFKLKRRAAGPDIFHEFLKFSADKGYKHYFYGDTEETLDNLCERLKKELPGIKTESFSPPFRKLNLQEDEEIIKKINDAKPDVLWVGLGLPKQERWIFDHKEKLKAPVVVGVGAAFKFEAGTVKRAPSWMGNAGLEWLWRLFQEPKRVWRRVFVDAPQFVWLAGSEFLKIKFRKNNG